MPVLFLGSGVLQFCRNRLVWFWLCTTWVLFVHWFAKTNMNYWEKFISEACCRFSLFLYQYIPISRDFNSISLFLLIGKVYHHVYTLVILSLQNDSATWKALEHSTNILSLTMNTILGKTSSNSPKCESIYSSFIIQKKYATLCSLSRIFQAYLCFLVSVIHVKHTALSDWYLWAAIIYLAGVSKQDFTALKLL